MTKRPGGTYIFSRDSVGAIGIQPQVFHWKYNGKNMVVTYMIGMDSVGHMSEKIVLLRYLHKKYQHVGIYCVR